MAIPLNILLAYLLGGITFLPACLLLILLHAHLTFPASDRCCSSPPTNTVDLQQPDEDARGFLSDKSARNLAAEFQGTHEPDVAAGYFAVCREYVPGGVNGKPPERTTPAGTVVAAESPSVYQSMYRSIFDRKQPPTLDSDKINGKAIKRARNVFFVVLRHGHLMLYEDSEQLEVKHVISLEHHHISIYGGNDTIPEGELWIKRNAIRLKRKATANEGASKPFFLFSENCSDKEDFYFALLQNQEVKADAIDNPPRPLQYHPKHIIGLVQKLHSSEEQLQTRWLNALIGRLFLALYKTADIEEFIYRKITKKIARAKKPAFLSNLVLQKIDIGDCAPQITNPRLKDLTIHGDCCAEADFKYNGNFRIEIAATARLDLGTRLKAREVHMVLAVVIKKLNGHVLLKFKPPPSNRIWISFERMPEMELAIEPIVSSRQITYGLIHRAIESRIREVVAETMVLPHWDDSPFTDTAHQTFRGGIWADQKTNIHLQRQGLTIPDESPEEEHDIVNHLSEVTPLQALKKNERIVSMPVLSDHGESEALSQDRSSFSQTPHADVARPSSPATAKADKPPKALRSSSFASAANPMLSSATADPIQPSDGRRKREHEDASSAMAAISSRSRPTSPNDSNAHHPPNVKAIWSGKAEGNGVASSNPELSNNNISEVQYTSELKSINPSGTSTPKSLDSGSNESKPDHRSLKSNSEQASVSSSSSSKNQSMAALGAATAAAKKWGWGVLTRSGDQKAEAADGHATRAGTPSNPIGRGQPLPPPGQPLPSPSNQRSKTVPSTTSKRVSSTSMPASRSEDTKARASPKPPLPARRRQSSMASEGAPSEGLLIVQAPSSEPTSPAEEVDGCNVVGESTTKQLPELKLPSKSRGDHGESLSGSEK